ncbi:hypothetical protein M9Y10_011653 [Tritrichomonas musculus]|uniref:Myb-like DNA-binding domain containing protein n=1 Tax=Tritrichomonas musculus TaxID=1915356 RepID=A0ABR2IK04_9EUKA
MEGNKNGKPEKKLQRKLFSIEEDAKLRFLVSQYGNKDFKKIATFMPGRTPRQVRERYKNYLSPEVNNGPWSRDEDALLCQKYMELGPKWSKIADFFPSRSDINVKNRWTSIKGTQPLNQIYKPNINCNTIKPPPAINQPPLPTYNHAMPILPNNPLMLPNVNNFPITSFSTPFKPSYNLPYSNTFINTYNCNNTVTFNNENKVKEEIPIIPQCKKPEINIHSENNLPSDDFFCDTEEFERDDSNFMFSFDSTLNAEQQTFIFGNDFEL